MNIGKSWLTRKDVAYLLNESVRNIGHMIARGEIKAHKEENGRVLIDKAEFFRMHPDAFQKANQEENTGKHSPKFLEARINLLERLLEERKDTNKLLTDQLNNFSLEKIRMLEVISSHARILEHKEAAKRMHNEVIIEQKPTQIKKKRWTDYFKRNKNISQTDN
jgi:hypothetical protein